MIPSHDSFYDVFSKGKKLKIQWPNGARLAVSLTGNLEAWTENPDPKIEKNPQVFNINLLRCVFCGLCVEACPVDAIRMDTKKIDMAGYTRDEFILDINTLLNNHPEGMSPTSVVP